MAENLYNPFGLDVFCKAKNMENSYEDKDDVGIIKGLKILKDKGKDITLYNLFKGIPISYNATILSVSEKSAVFKVHKYQAAALEMEKMTYIASDYFPKNIKADASIVDITERKATLVDFSYKEIPIVKRKFIRVQPADPMKVIIITDDNVKTTAELADISMVGMGVYVSKKENLTEHQDIQFSLKLSAEKELKLHGKIVTISGQENHYRLGVEIFNTSSSEILISQYVTARQREIMTDLSLKCLS